MATARMLSDTGMVQLFRAGLWKPRTRPDSFEGVGARGLPWLARVKAEYKLAVTTEVATADHVEKCLDAGIDVLWIGARTTVNPFSVQEIADALVGTDIPVIIKNPLNADLDLWIGAIERIRRAGVKRIAAMHRGFSFYGEKTYRNKPLWEIPIALKSRFPDLMVFCDPSHICGRRDLLQEVAQQSMDLGMCGLMLESHPSPDEAWSDAAQQITPDQLVHLINNLQLRSPGGEGVFQDRLAVLRQEIDNFDEEIIRLLAQRMLISEHIGEFKASHHIQPLDIERWNEIRISRLAWAHDLGLSGDFMLPYLDQLHNESLRRQTAVMNAHRQGTPAEPDLPQSNS